MKKYLIPRNYVRLGEYLYKKRTQANLTQREVSIALGYSSAQFISNFERGIAAPSLKKLAKLSEIYSMPPVEVVDLLLEAEREVMLANLKPQRRSSR
jgi:transcriptional regulator with XRE-family HTH domain